MSAEAPSNPAKLEDFDLGKDSEAKPGSPTAKAEAAQKGKVETKTLQDLNSKAAKKEAKEKAKSNPPGGKDEKPAAAPAGDSQGKPEKTDAETVSETESDATHDEAAAKKSDVKTPDDPKDIDARQKVANEGDGKLEEDSETEVAPDAETEAAKKDVEKKAEHDPKLQEDKPKVAAMPPRTVSQSEAVRLLSVKQYDRAERIIMTHAPVGPVWKGIVLAMRKDTKTWAEKSHKGWQDGVLAALRAEGFLDAESRSGRLEDIHVALVEHCARKWEAGQPKF